MLSGSKNPLSSQRNPGNGNGIGAVLRRAVRLGLLWVGLGLPPGVFADEGSAAKLHSIRFHGHHFLREQQLRDVMTQKQGFRFDRLNMRSDFLRQDSLALLRLYREEGFLDARVDSVRFYGDIKGRVTQHVYLQENERYIVKRVVFRGREGIRRRRLKKVIQLSTGDLLETRPLNPGLIPLDSLSLLRFYRDQGYNDIRVDSVTVHYEDARKNAVITFHLREGSRYSLESLSLPGRKEMPRRRILRAMGTRPSGWIRTTPFRPDRMNRDSLAVVTLYRNRGFLDARVDSVRFEYREGTRKAKETISVWEGSLYVIDSVALVGNRFFPTEDLRTLLHMEVGEPFNQEKVRDTQIAIAREYTNAGFLTAQLYLNYTKLPGNYLDLRFTIQEGPRLRVGGFRVLGNRKTREAVVRRAIPLQEGDWIHYDRLMRGQKRLYETGIFSGVSIQLEPVPDDSLTRVVLIRVRERKAGALEFGGGYGTQEEWRALSGLRAANLRGDASRASFQFEANRIQSELGATYEAPWILGSQFDGKLGTGLTFRTDTILTHVETGTDRPLGDYENLGLLYRLEFGPLDTLAESAHNGAVRPLYTFDSRDDVFVTREGSLSQIELEYAAPYTYSEYHYLKGSVDTRLFYSPGLKNTVALRVRMGVLQPIDGAPFTAYYREGGDQSVRGYQTRSLPDSSSLGSAGEVVLSGEYRQKVVGPWGFALFVDGALLSSPEAFLENLQRFWGAGMGLRYLFPLGVLRLDWAPFAATPMESEFGSLYFALGHSF